MSPRRLARMGLIVLLVFPLWWMALKAGLPSLPPFAPLAQALVASLWQSALSTMISLGLGAWGALGLCALRRPSWILTMELLVLVPAWLPTLFVLLGVMSFVTQFAQFPFGLFGVVMIHVWINAGLVAVALSRLMRARLGGQIELAWLEGATRWQFLRSAIGPSLKNEIAILGLVVFGFCLTSLAVPLIAGGPNAQTLDLFAYQQVQFGQGVGTAMGVAWIEVVLLALLVRWLARPALARRDSVVNLRFLAMPSALIVFVGLGLILVVATLFSLPRGLEQMSDWPQAGDVMLEALTGTVLISAGTGILVALALSMIAFLMPHQGFRGWLLALNSPSTLLVGLAFFSLGPALGWFVGFKLMLALTLLFVPVLYRWLIDGALVELREQIFVARTLGASWGLIWRRITLPQLLPELSLTAALAALWAAGDFALSGLIASQDITLAMLVEDLLSSYRLEMASLMMAILLMIAFLISGAFLGAGYVLGRKH